MDGSEASEARLKEVVASLQARAAESEALREAVKAAEQTAAEQTAALGREKERNSLSLANVERRCENLKAEMRELLRKEQEYEETIEGLRSKQMQSEEKGLQMAQRREALEQRAEDAEDAVAKLTERLEAQKAEMESLGIQLATYKS